MKPKRNDSCNCGSGKKYKVCHGKTESASNNQVYLVFGGLLATFIFLFFGQTNSTIENTTVSQSPILPYTNRSSSKPPGNAPAGKVWSEAHGHWHDAPAQSSGPIENNHHSFTPSSRPDKNNPPPGMVWSEAHGHFHEDPQKKSVKNKITPKRVKPSKKKAD